MTERTWDKRKNIPSVRGDRTSYSAGSGDRTGYSAKITQSRLNPTINGRISRCRHCDSNYHWVKYCPHKQQYVKVTEDQDDQLPISETVNITLYLEPKPGLSPQSVFVTETYNTAVIDTACT